MTKIFLDHKRTKIIILRNKGSIGELSKP